ncbi:MAG: hypothetical protein KKE77_09540 [Alphaproteobacteria bacterium]|nr:hypothetical protein [Alphaproteobacteria bacterium]MBU2272280.1 hypothetical protein [Alphaproteobacteria bacterium]MBU2341468.1 hypothetical protein [Alphaproteobacteria bacterium]
MADQSEGSREAQRLTTEDVGVFNVVDLLVDEDNFRLEPNANQPAALKAMLKRQGRKIVALAEEIQDRGLSAGEFVWLAPDPRPENAGKYVVCEGNRRVTALKILNEPALADGTPWEKRFRELGQQFKESPVRQVRAVLYASVDAARPDVYRRHTNDQDGRGLEAWDPFAQDRANKAIGRRRTLSMVVMEHLTTSTIEGLADGVGIRDRTTNADRMFGTFSEEFSSEYGIKIRAIAPHIDLGPDPARAEEILWAILRASDVAVDAIKSKGQRVAILKDLLAEIDPPEAGVTDEERPAAGDRSEESDRADHTSGNSGARSREGKPGGLSTDREGADATSSEEDANATGRNPRRDPLTRKTLAPTDRRNTLHVSGNRLIGLYNECRGADVASRPNSAAMLLRVFLELSCEAYLEHIGARPPSGRSDWSDFGIQLETKVKKVLDKIDHDRTAKDLADAHNGLSEDRTQSHSIRSLHRAMHDRNHVPDAHQIKVAWQRWHPLFRRIHDAIDLG